jgi:1,4-alpha-glucan branching enzyme
MVADKFPGRMTIAEDSQNNKWLTKDVGAGGAGFGSQWDAEFVHPIRQAVITHEDQHRSVIAIRDALCHRYNDDAFERVIYSESHDEVANGSARPMLFQGQEFLEGNYFRDTVPVDWDQRDEFHGIVRLYRDLIRLRLNRDGFTRGLCGQFTRVFHLNDERKLLAYHRWDKGGPGDDVVVVANFLNEPQDGYVIGFPAAGTW